MPLIRGTLQLDFDGTLAEGDVSTGILSRFVSPEWMERVNAAGRELLTDPESTSLVDTMVEGYARLGKDFDGYLQYAHEHHPARAGLADLVETAVRLGLECHVVSNGFEFYIRDYLREAGIHEQVSVHSGATTIGNRLAYLGPNGRPVTNRFKLRWAEHFLAARDLLVYVGDGTSDVAPAQRASIVFACDSLLTGIPADFPGTLHPFDTLHDVARGLEKLLNGR